MSQTEKHEFYSGLIIKKGAGASSAIKKATSGWIFRCFGKQ